MAARAAAALPLDCLPGSTAALQLEPPGKLPPSWLLLNRCYVQRTLCRCDSSCSWPDDETEGCPVECWQ